MLVLADVCMRAKQDLDRFQIDLSASNVQQNRFTHIAPLAESPCPKEKRGSFVPYEATHLSAQLQSNRTRSSRGLLLQTVREKKRGLLAAGL